MDIVVNNIKLVSGHGSVGRALASQAEGRGFESRCPLQNKLPLVSSIHTTHISSITFFNTG